MRRFIVYALFIGLILSSRSSDLCAQQADGPQLQKLRVPAAQARSLATKLSLRYRDVAGVQISPDARNEQLVVMAPEVTQQQIANDVQTMLTSGQLATPPGKPSGPVQHRLANITWREFEDDLQRVVGHATPVTTSRNGARAAFQLVAAPLQGTTVEVDRRANSVTVMAPQPSLPGWRSILDALDQVPAKQGEITELMRLENAEPAPIQRALRLLKEVERNQKAAVAAAAVGINSPFRNAVFQQDGNTAAAGAAQADAGKGASNDGAAEPGEETDDEAGAGVIGDTRIQFVPELGTIIIRGAKRDVQRVMEVIKEIEEQSKVTRPEVQVVQLKYADSNAVAALLAQLYEDVLSARQGDVSITSLDSPNALLLIGRTEAIQGLMELINKIDQPIEASSRLRVFRLQNASAVDAEQTIRNFFSARPGIDEEEFRPGVGPRVRVLADYRTNSLIVSAAPRDMTEVTRLINELDIQEHSTQNEIKVFPLKNASAEDLAPVLQSAINGEGEGAANDNLTPPSTSLSIVAVDSEGNRVIGSGILAGAVVTADTGANAIIVRAPAASMPLISELIRQVDVAPGIDSLVKVFTIENGDAVQLTLALQELFGADAGTTGTSVGAANLAGLPPSTASSDSSLVPLRFSTDQRTNSIIASGSAEDLEVVESILLRLDSEGFAERITEVIWLRHQTAADVATAIQTYVQQRTQTVNTIQQYQQGLGPYDLPDRDLIVVAEPVSNSVLLSVSPRLYEDVRAIIDKLDRRPPMVLMKVVIAEVKLDDTFEIGGEVGLQDALLYDRGIAAGSFPGATAPSNPGFNFNGNGTPNLNSFGQESLAAGGLSSFGLGTTSAKAGYGGFVLSAASESVSLLFRTLQDANRFQIISRPQIMTMDNTDGYVQVGRQIARVTGVANNGTVAGGVQVATEDIEIGLIMQVRPRVGADGLIVMDVDATRSDRDTNSGTQVPTGNAVTPFIIIDDIRRTTAQSTIAAYSGQTVVFGGLIQKTRDQFSRRVPFLADIPLLGYFFKYDQEFEDRTEVLIILTPMLVNGDEDLEYIKQVESSRMSWCLADVVEAHGDVGLSGGNGLWGPAMAKTIYPDLQPTVDEVIISDTVIDSGRIGNGSGSHSTVHPNMNRGVEILSDEALPPPGNSLLQGSESGELYGDPDDQAPVYSEPRNLLPSGASTPVIRPASPLAPVQPAGQPSALPNKPVQVGSGTLSPADSNLGVNPTRNATPNPSPLEERPARSMMRQASWIDALGTRQNATPSSEIRPARPARLGQLSETAAGRFKADTIQALEPTISPRSWIR